MAVPAGTDPRVPHPPDPAGRRRRGRVGRAATTPSVGFLVPSLLFIAGMGIYPLYVLLVMSVSEVKPATLLREWPFVGFDTDRSHGSLRRFYAEYASEALVDQYEALDRIVEAALARAGVRVLVDLAAQTHDPLVKWMDESGVLDMGNPLATGGDGGDRETKALGATGRLHGETPRAGHGNGWAGWPRRK